MVAIRGHVAEWHAEKYCDVTQKVRGESLQKNYNMDQAVDNRDAVAKGIYGKLFGWLVSRANKLLAPENKAAFAKAQDREGGVTNVGILDIFGFENFKSNSFEQLCINVANEQLQFYFNQHIFAWELSAYGQEGIAVSSITYKDNQSLLGQFFCSCTSTRELHQPHVNVDVPTGCEQGS